jgi:hypothetical protein
MAVKKEEVANRAVTTAQPAPAAPAPAGTVRVRALRALAEEIDGNVIQFARGQEFNCPADRVAALGALVEPVKSAR